MVAIFFSQDVSIFAKVRILRELRRHVPLKDMTRDTPGCCRRHTVLPQSASYAVGVSIRCRARHHQMLLPLGSDAAALAPDLVYLRIKHDG
ncbi:MAG TPA: hypothetical protein IAA99_05910 [Candidatus Avibacteroides faecavium]|nr:hypothetical protein [Candidatus Avibacteroides faecavium]